MAQFLAQEGYYETARTFAEEVREESVTLENGQSRSLYQHEPGEDIDTANRQSKSFYSRAVLSNTNEDRNPRCYS